MIETIEFKGEVYPAYQSKGNAAKFCLPFALEICKGDVILDIGYSNNDWKFPNAIGVDIKDNNGYDAYTLPPLAVDSIFSSHLLEHLERPFEALDIWTDKIKKGGTMFLYLPHPSQVYWLPFHNRKHYHSFTPELIKNYFLYSDKYKNIFTSGVDANNSFTCFAEKI